MKKNREYPPPPPPPPPVDAVPVPIRYAWTQRCFKVSSLMTQLPKVISCCLCYHFKSVSGGICVSSLVPFSFCEGWSGNSLINALCFVCLC